MARAARSPLPTSNQSSPARTRPGCRDVCQPPLLGEVAVGAGDGELGQRVRVKAVE